MARLNYLELPVRDVARLKQFYEQAFGWSLSQFGPDYAATTSDDVEIGLNGDADEWTAQLLPVIEVDDIDSAVEQVTRAGGTVSRPIFAFPGGRRFHFRDPHGHELAVWTKAPEQGDAA
ncbi:VOC family protein [Stakelama saccharophila]|uniref:VOC family protein n=1 Tax=Stakelama saccharophila TaxID=3075605 RepID=A0ABZ0B771_9SPHN|nr:VOC family protein [Stakelama sp. W311]WNO52466.1 VOC family protein [Stakelama sp. W311]